MYIKALEANLLMFQFYPEIDGRRVIDGIPWSFNRRALLIARLQEDVNPRCIPLNTIDLWVQIYDMQPGFMSEKVIMEIGNQIGVFVSSCPNNYKGVWRDYMRIRVTIDVTKSLKRRLKLRKTGNEWSWVTFKYENVPTFCFICGVLGHADKFCSRLFEVSESEVTKPYGTWMRSPLRRSNMMFGSKWLRYGTEDSNFNEAVAGGASGSQARPPANSVNRFPMITGGEIYGTKDGDITNKNPDTGIKSGITSQVNDIGGEKSIKRAKRVILENKKRRMDSGTDNMLGLNTELEQESDTEEVIGMDQDMVNGSKNEFVAGSESQARLEL